jgi:putative acetyltransferase
VSVRLAADDDWPAILDVHGAAFGDEDIRRLARDLHESEAYVPELSLVAVADGAVVGHVMNTWSGVEGSTARLLQLSPLGVLPEQQGKGFGSALVRESIEGARRRGEAALLVEGNPKYYGRFGFVRADELGLLPPPEALYDWAFQVIVLDEGVELPQGRVIYSEPFRR